jgi:hypothetical protein
VIKNTVWKKTEGIEMQSLGSIARKWNKEHPERSTISTKIMPRKNVKNKTIVNIF